MTSQAAAFRGAISPDLKSLKKSIKQSKKRLDLAHQRVERIEGDLQEAKRVHRLAMADLQRLLLEFMDATEGVQRVTRA